MYLAYWEFELPPYLVWLHLIGTSDQALYTKLTAAIVVLHLASMCWWPSSLHKACADTLTRHV